ncbi:Isoamylase 3, chloroplastic [Trifolium repens]|nr:Isoamylase 3, chloroplastic [Trifolium repens]
MCEEQSTSRLCHIHRKEYSLVLWLLDFLVNLLEHSLGKVIELIFLVLSTEVARLKAIAKDVVLLRCKVIAEPYDCGGPILLEVFQIGTGGLNGMGYIVMTCRNLSRISIMNFREQVNMCVISLSLIYD